MRGVGSTPWHGIGRVNNKNFQEKVDNIGVLELDVTFNDFVVFQLHTCYETLLCANEINVQLIKNQ